MSAYLLQTHEGGTMKFFVIFKRMPTPMAKHCLALSAQYSIASENNVNTAKTTTTSSCVLTKMS